MSELSETGLSDVLLGREAAHPNPAYDFLTGFIPRKLKDLLKWAEWLVYNSAHVYGVVKKFGEYPITTITYKTDIPADRQQYDELMNTVKAKGFLTMASFDKWTYGNGFYSLYEPFKRMLKCPSCRTEYAVDQVTYKYETNKVLFKYSCPACKQYVATRPKDFKVKSPEKMNIIRWDPKLMDIEHNPITGESVYYYTIPNQIISAIERGSTLLINSMPIEFLRTVAKRGKVFQFAPGQLYHMKVPGPAGLEAHWGFPPLTSAIKLFLFAAILRKANEAVAMEHIVPFRILFPSTGSQQGDPVATINLAQWREEMTTNLKRWRRDPLHMMFSPAPVGLQDIGGQGRALLTLGELQEAEKNIVLSMGVPMEFLTGGLGQTRGDITLRMIENQLRTHIEDLNALLQWLVDKAGRHMGWRPVTATLADFKMIDDTEKKQLLISLWQAGEVSGKTVKESLNIDPDQERNQIKQDAILKMQSQLETQTELNKIQNSLGQQATQQAQQSQAGMAYDQQQVIAQADQLVQEMQQLQPGLRKSRLDSLQNEDYVMYSVVSKRLEQAQTDQDAELRAQAQQQQQSGVAA
jgi:hypothetical protein